MLHESNVAAHAKCYAQYGQHTSLLYDFGDSLLTVEGRDEASPEDI